MKLETTTTLEPKRELIELRLLDAWARNPRGEDLEDLDAFTAQIEREGGIREDLHAFTMPTGRLTLMQGHRRRAVGLRLGIEKAVSYTHLTLPTTLHECRSRWSPYH